jgi:hypothetical protein
MTVIRPNSISGITSITAQANEINVFRSDGTLAGLQLNGVNFNNTSGISTLAALNVTGNVSIAGTLTYQDVTNVDSVGIITARSTIDAQGDVSIADKIIHTGDTNTAIRFPATDVVSFETSGNERVRITSDGAIGIGTESPTGSLHIHSGTPQITLSDSDTGAHGQINCASSEGNLYVEVDKNSGITTAAHKPRFGVRLRGKEWFGITHNGTWRLDNGYGSMETGSAGQVLTSGGPNSWARWTDQTDVLDMWRIASDVTDSDQTVRFFGIGDWVQKTGDPYANLGYIGAYETNGIFRMPSTGYYEIEMIIGWNVYNGTCKGCTNAIYTTTDNSNYVERMRSAVHTGGGQAGTNESCNKIKLFWKVNNISNDKFKISYHSFNGNPYVESTTSWLYIKKLRDL